MDNANTGIVGNGIFFHYCHKISTLMALRVHHSNCPLCNQKNPGYIQNNMIFTVSHLETGCVVMSFADQQRAIDFIQKNPNELWALGDTGYVK